MADSPLNTSTKFKPGGTGHIVKGGLLGRVASHEKDRLGRWTCVNLIGRDRKIAIFSIYQSPVGSLNNSHITFHAQQRIIYETEKTNPEEKINDKTPRKRFRQDLVKTLDTKLADDYEIMIMGDFNDTFENDKSVLHDLAGRGFKDVWAEKGHPEIATYQRGTKRLDYCLATSKIYSAITAIHVTNFKEIANSDHRGLVVDIDPDSLFNKKQVTEYHERQLFSNDRKQVGKYLLAVASHLKENNAYIMMEELQGEPALQEAKLERLDNIITEAMLSAERKLKTRRRPWWSNKINRARFKIRLLQNHHSRLKQNLEESPVIQFKLDDNGFNVTLPRTLTKNSVEIQKAKEELKEIISNSRKYREEEQLARHDYLNRNGMKSQAEVIKRIWQKERLADAYRQVKTLRNKSQDQKANKVDIPRQWTETENLEEMEDPKSTTDWISITEPHLIKKYMLLRNKVHFHQAEGTPMTTRHWRNMLDWAAESETAKQITAGTFGTTGLQRTHEAVIQECKCPLSEPLISYQLTSDTFRDRVKHWRESTATSPSGRHLGHYRSLATSLAAIPNQETRDKLISIQDNIIQLLVDVINYTVHFKYSLKRWHRIESAMIPKDAGSVKIHRMRVIHIFEADYNLLLGLKWREVDTGLYV